MFVLENLPPLFPAKSSTQLTPKLEQNTKETNDMWGEIDPT